MALALADNGVHEYYETDRFLVFRNHGERRWYALAKRGGGHQLLGSTPIYSPYPNRRGREIVGSRCRTFSTADDAVSFARKATS